MTLKALAPLGLFGILSTGSYSMAMVPLEDTGIDEDFYVDLDLKSRFDETVFKNKERIESDTLGARDYFFNNSYNLVWRAKSGTESSKSGNAFLLNILLPDWITEYHPERNNYSPKSYIGGDEVVMLLGTSFSFAKDLFDKVNDWKTEVNEKTSEVNEKTSEVTLKECSNHGSNNELLFSHPWPSLDGNRFTQKHLYRLGEDLFGGFDEEVEKPYFFSVKPEDVSAVYAAVDLEVNKELLNFSANSEWNIREKLLRIHQDSSPQYSSEVSDIYGNRYSLAVDFAVIKVKFNISKIKRHFLDYLVSLYEKKNRIPRILSTEFEVRSGRTDPIYLAGWEPMDEEQIDFHTMDNLFVKANVKDEKKSDASSNAPSTYANETKFSECCELDLYETYTSRSSNTTGSKSDTYEVTDKKFYPNDVHGLMYIEYKIKTKDKVLPKVKGTWISGFKGNSQQADSISSWNEQRSLFENQKLTNFLEFKPKAHAMWRESGISYAHFPMKFLQNVLNEKTWSSNNGSSSSLNMNSPVSTFSLNSKTYLNISHYLDVPNLNLKNSKGILAIMKDPDRNEKVMLGMYAGTSTWANPLSLKDRHVGKIAMFISPWRYDLFNEGNKLSKPSLGDILVKKKLNTKIIQINRFKMSNVEKN